MITGRENGRGERRSTPLLWRTPSLATIFSVGRKGSFLKELIVLYNTKQYEKRLRIDGNNNL
jgi:hypothetical protein